MILPTFLDQSNHINQYLDISFNLQTKEEKVKLGIVRGGAERVRSSPFQA